MHAGEGLFGIQRVDLVIDFSAFFSDGEQSWGSEGFQRIRRFGMPRAQSEVRVIGDIGDQQGYGRAYQYSIDDSPHPRHAEYCNAHERNPCARE